MAPQPETLPPLAALAGAASADGGKPALAAALDLFDVDLEMFAENRGRVVQLLRARADVASDGVLLLQGGPAPTRYDSDHEPVFRQESNFAYLFGVKEPDVHAVIELASGSATLFFPALPAEYAIAMGEVRGAESFRREYGVEAVKFAPDLAAFMRELAPSVVYVTRGLNADSGIRAKEASFDGLEDFRVDNGVLYDALVHCRVRKSARELALMRHVNRISSEAHCWVMRLAQPGMREFQLESLFAHWGYFRGGCRHQSYTSICGCGANGAVLHYGHAGAPNDGALRDGDMCLLDMGAELRCYASDITCSFPVGGGGRLSPDQRMVYEAVLAAQWTVMRAMRPGVSYVDMHALSYATLLRRLRDGGLLRGDLEGMAAANLGAVFMPHGLGHFMGLDTHDVGGRPRDAPKQTRDGFKSLRCVVELEPGMVVTVEPGCYFSDFALDRALANPEQARFIDADVLQRFRGFGGVRLEDDVVVTETGIENLTRCPRTVDDVEAVLAGVKDHTSSFATYEDASIQFS